MPLLDDLGLTDFHSWTPWQLRQLAARKPHWSGAHKDLASAALAFADLIEALTDLQPEEWSAEWMSRQSILRHQREHGST